MPSAISPDIFKAYDIRGIVDRSLTEEVVAAIGGAFARMAREAGAKSVAIGRDGRLSGPAFSAALSRGLRASGLEVVDCGRIATPMLYYAATTQAGGTGIMITGSHNPPEYNGLKMMLNGASVHGDEIQRLRVLATEPAVTAAEAGGERGFDPAAAYLDRILSDVRLARPMKIVVDCGNGVPGAFAPELYRRLGCTVTELFCEVDGTFPNHHPDPADPHNLEDVVRALREGDAEIGFAFDGDGDRLGVVTKAGQVIWPDRQMMLFAQDVLSRNPGASIIYDVKCSRNLAKVIEAAGGQPLMWKTGHSLIKAKLKETGAPLAGEMSGHIFFKERWYGFDDAMYAGARLLEILSRHADPSALLNALPNALATPELKLNCAEGENFTVIDRLKAEARFDGAERIVDIDGVRVEYADGFGLARPSNTTPVVVLRFEADSEAALKRIQEDFRRALTAVKPDAQLPF
jgi:phosphomannomutase/phosphoglucomutase